MPSQPSQFDLPRFSFISGAPGSIWPYKVPLPIFKTDVTSSTQKNLRRSNAMFPFLPKMTTINNAVHCIIAQVRMNSLDSSMKLNSFHRSPFK